MYEDIPLTISEMMAQPNSVKVINDISKFYQDCLNISLDFKQTYIGQRVDEQSLIKFF